MLRSEVSQMKAATLAALLETLRAKAPYLKRDAECVARLSADMARCLGIGASETQVIEDAGLLHDIGMINTQETVLLKNGPLSKLELAQVRNHVLVGTEILQPLSYLGHAIDYVRYHHERLDGSGYPDGLRNEQIPLGAQIVGTADAYAALTDDRPYRAACSLNEAILTLRASEGVWFDGQVLDALEWAARETDHRAEGNP